MKLKNYKCVQLSKQWKLELKKILMDTNHEYHYFCLVMPVSCEIDTIKKYLKRIGVDVKINYFVSHYNCVSLKVKK